ncbi:MAG: methylenetetrahydrofolate reductase C-terminal domain-containing protein [Dehalococcoidales bacterium]|nr:methylenetetrahydrofolate reductase C-terminal domain-containing protein [Dehalococcoidales bacterium]
MIVGERKPFNEIKDKIGQYKKVLILGCGTCVSVCMAGGEKEVEILASELRVANKLAGKDVEIGQATITRQCDKEFIEPVVENARKFDAILSMACGAGVQLVSDVVAPMPIIPALNTDFIGITESEGVWVERCRACGNCLLAETGGVCPVTRCAKGLLNGPCGGTNNGKCEVSPEKDCAWTLIYQRLDKQGRLDLFDKYNPPRNHQAVVTPGRVTKS